MNLPNYFLADLPADASLNPAMITEACRTLKRNRPRFMAGRSTSSLIEILREVAGNWRRDDYPLRKRALELGPAATGFSMRTLANGLDTFFAGINTESLQSLVLQELGHSRRLEQFVAARAEQETPRLALARGPEFLVHIAGGRLPNAVFMSMILGLLSRSAQLIKCPTGGAFLPRLFAHSLYETDPKLGACLEIAEWRGGREDLEEALFAEADCVTATGNDETLASIRRRVPINVRFVGYGHRVSFGYVAHEVLTASEALQTATKAAIDVAAWNQLGCLSPHLFYVERGGPVSPEEFAALLAGELARREAADPRGAIAVEEAATIATRRMFYEVRASASLATRVWSSRESTDWTVVYEEDPAFQISCLNRFIHVKTVTSPGDALRAAETVRGKISTVGVAVPESRAAALATELAQWGVPRICPLGQMQNPPVTWRHDGRPALGELVTWADWEQT